MYAAVGVLPVGGRTDVRRPRLSQVMRWYAAPVASGRAVSRPSASLVKAPETPFWPSGRFAASSSGAWSAWDHQTQAVGAASDGGCDREAIEQQAMIEIEHRQEEDLDREEPQKPE